MQQPPLATEFQREDIWQRGVFDRLLRPVMREYAYGRQAVFLDCASSIASLLQRTGHVDVVAQLPLGGTMLIEVKIVRWPHAKDGIPGDSHWRDFFLETAACGIPGRERAGWMYTSKADILLWCQCSLAEDSLKCWALPFARLSAWFWPRLDGLRERTVENPLDGVPQWSRGRLAPIEDICDALGVEPFHVGEGGRVIDRWGKPTLLWFLQQRPSEAA